MVTLPKGRIGNEAEVLNSYYETKQIIPFEICMRQSGNPGYYYHFLPEFNPQCFAKLHPEDVAKDLIDQTERNVVKISYLSPISPESAKDMHSPEATGEKCIYLAWIGLWCSTLWYQASEERLFRTEQLLAVLSAMKEKRWEVSMNTLQLIMQSCLMYGSPEMVIKVYNHLNELNIKANGSLCSIYFKAILLSQKNLQKPKKSIKDILGTKELGRNIRKEVFSRKELLDYMSANYKAAVTSFKKRTFCTESELNVIGDKVAMFVEENRCALCRVEYGYEDMLRMALVVDSEASILEVNCPECKKAIIPNIRVRVGNRYTFGEPNVPSYVEQVVILMFPQEFKKNVERLALQSSSKVKTDLRVLKTHYSNIFWNSIWHFTRLSLPYDLFLLYSSDVYCEGVVQNVSQVAVSAVGNWESEDRNELGMQKKYEEKIRKKIPYKHIGVQIT